MKFNKINIPLIEFYKMKWKKVNDQLHSPKLQRRK